MRFTKLNSDKFVWINTGKYAVNWDKKVGSKFQFEVKKFFYPFWKRNIVCEEFRIPGSLLRIDLVNLTTRMIVEANGEQHENYNPHFHQGSKNVYLNQIKRDVAKFEWAKKNNFLFIEIEPKDLPLTREFIFDKYNIKLI